MNFSEVLFQQLLSGISQSIPLIIIISLIILRENNEAVEHLHGVELFLNQLELNVELAGVLVFALHSVLHYFLVVLSDHSNQEVDEHHRNEQLIQEGEEPDCEHVAVGQVRVFVVNLFQFTPLNV